MNIKTKHKNEEQKVKTIELAGRADSRTLYGPELGIDTRSKILQTAVKVFSEFGYNGASLRQITTLTQVNHGSIKYHYNGKEALWRACVIYLYAQLEYAFMVADAKWVGMSMRKRIEHSMSIYIRFQAKQPALARITMFETVEKSSRLDWLNKKVTIPYTEKSLALIGDAQKEGVYPANIPDMNMFYLLLGAIRYTYLVAPEAARMFGKDVTDDEEIKRHEDAVIQLFLAQVPEIDG